MTYWGHISGIGSGAASNFDASHGFPPDTRTYPCAGPFEGNITIEVRIDAQGVGTIHVDFDATIPCAGGGSLGVSGQNRMDPARFKAGGPFSDVVRVQGSPGSLDVSIPTSSNISVNTPTGGDLSLAEGKASLRAKLPSLKANAGGPYSCRRGEEVQLDGSHSEGDDLKYRWTFVDHCPDGPIADRSVVLQGAHVSVRLLCNTDVTLVVTDGKSGRSSEPATVQAHVTPRKEFVTTFHESGWKWEGAPTFYQLKIRGTEKHLGRNACSFEGVQSAHWIHRADDASYSDLYELAQLRDAGGPYDGLWYVSQIRVLIDRTRFVNVDLAPESISSQKNEKSSAYRESWKLLLEQVKMHEQIHSDLVRERLADQSFDPARRADQAIATDRDSLDGLVTGILRETESAIVEEVTNHARVKERMPAAFQNASGVVLLEDAETGKWEEWRIPNYATLGDD